jgi:hypothetical protein
MRARMLVVCAAAVALGATPAAALAHNVSPPSPRAGNGGSVFTFKGRAWQPSRRITVAYFRRESDMRPFRRMSFVTSRRGRFTFRLVNPWFFDTGRMQRMCFSQFDTRYGRRFGECERFYVAPASAYFMPADGVVGDQPFILVVNGFQAGHTLDVELTRPDGVVETYRMTTRTRSGFVTGGEFGALYVLRGGGFLRFQSSPTDLVGLYTAFVFDPNAQARARAAVLVRSG